MNIKAIIYGAFAYTLITFPIAVIWHVVLFKEKYQVFGYFEGEPNFIIGLLTIIIQGGILSFLYPYVAFSGKGIVRGLKFSMVVGIFFWSSHVLALIAKQTMESPLVFIAMESFYLVFQFGIYGMLIGAIYESAAHKNA